MKTEHLETFRAAGAIQRYHTVRTLRNQTVGEHSWNVAILVLMVCPSASAELIKAALTHDVAEIVTGDIPATAKWRNPDIKALLTKVEQAFEEEHGIIYDLDVQEYRVLKWCDMMELVLWCQEEMELGNKYATPIHVNGIKFLQKHGHPTHQAKEMFNLITSHWRQHGSE